MKHKVIIWGTGSGFLKRKEFLTQQYDILAVTDNSGKIGFYEGFPRIFPNEIKTYPFDKVVICNIEFYESIKYQLLYDFHLKNEQLLWVNHSENYSAQQKIFDSVEQYNKLNERTDFAIERKNLHLISNDYYQSAGQPVPHYFAQDIWGARKIYESGTKEHYDIGSRLDGFLAHLLVFCPKIYYIDIRPFPFSIPHLEFIQSNASELTEINDNSILSLSSFHAVEHFGLGRYGDPIDPEACFKALHSMERVLAIDGHLYLGVPIASKNKLIFNAHRLFRPKTIIESFHTLKLLEFSVIIGNDCYERQVPLNKISEESDQLPDFSCGLFEFIKRR